MYGWTDGWMGGLGWVVKYSFGLRLRGLVLDLCRGQLVKLVVRDDRRGRRWRLAIALRTILRCRLLSCRVLLCCIMMCCFLMVQQFLCNSLLLLCKLQCGDVRCPQNQARKTHTDAHSCTTTQTYTKRLTFRHTHIHTHRHTHVSHRHRH